jgi:hypothetical protein
MTAEAVTPNDDINTFSDRDLLERLCKQADHLDKMLHAQGQLLDELRPLLPHVPRALTLLNLGGAMRKKRTSP